MSAGGLVDFRRLLRFFARGRLDRPLDAKDWARSSLCAADQGYRVVPGGEPHLQLVGADDVADQQVVGAVVARLRRLAGHRTRLLEHDLVRVQQSALARRVSPPRAIGMATTDPNAWISWARWPVRGP